MGRGDKKTAKGKRVTGLLLPKEPLKRFPLAVFLSPLPMLYIF